VDRIGGSSHVRALIFSVRPVSGAYAIIDNQKVKMVQVNDSNLWVAPWKPMSGSPGNVTIIATDRDGNIENVTNIYNLQYDRIMPSKVFFQIFYRKKHIFFKFSPLGTFILSVDFCVYFGFAFWLSCTIPLLFMFLMSPIFAKISGRQVR